MKIVNRNTFLSFPPGIVFCKYTNNQFEELCIKGDSLESDFTYLSLVNNLTTENQNAVEDGDERYLDYTNWERDGCFDENQEFAVHHKWDVEGLIRILQHWLNK